MRVFFADDQIKVRSALRLLLEQEPQLFMVAGEAADAQGLLAQAPAVRPDLVLLDWELPGTKPNGHPAVVRSSCELSAALRASCSPLHVVVLSGWPEARQPALDAGADAFVSKGDPPEQLLAVLHALGSE